MTFFWQQIFEADHLSPLSLVTEIFLPWTPVLLGLHGLSKLVVGIADMALLSPFRFGLYFCCLLLRTLARRGRFLFNLGALLVYCGIFVCLDEWFGKALGIVNLF